MKSQPKKAKLTLEQEAERQFQQIVDMVNGSMTDQGRAEAYAAELQRNKALLGLLPLTEQNFVWCQAHI
jgi:hypothetical protein